MMIYKYNKKVLFATDDEIRDKHINASLIILAVNLFQGRTLLSSLEFTRAHCSVTNGLSESDHGLVKVDMAFSTFHIGAIQCKCDVSSNRNSNIVTYTLFHSNVWGSDGFWDPGCIDANTLGKIPCISDWTETKSDGPGLNLERFGGTPFFYKTREGSFFYKPPVEGQK